MKQIQSGEAYFYFNEFFLLLFMLKKIFCIQIKALATFWHFSINKTTCEVEIPTARQCQT